MKIFILGHNIRIDYRIKLKSHLLIVFLIFPSQQTMSAYNLILEWLFLINLIMFVINIPKHNLPNQMDFVKIIVMNSDLFNSDFYKRI